MIGNLLAGAISLAQPIGAEPLGTSTYFVANPYIEKISCLEGSGTGFRLEDGTWVSVNHVTSMTACSVDGIPIKVTYADPVGDFSTFTVPGDDRRGGLKPDCSGYQNGQWLYGVGHARGLPILTAIAVMYTRVLNAKPHERGWAVLAYNRFIPGQSGGAVLNRSGEVTGTVNAYSPFFPISFSKPLRDTPICRS